MSTKIGDYSLSKDRSTVYYNDVAIYKVDGRWLSHDLYTEDGEVCFYDGTTRSIYHVKKNEVKRIYNNVSFFSILNLDIWKGSTEDGKTVFLKLIDDTYFQKLLVCSKDYSSYGFQNGYCLSEDDFELLLHSYDLDEYCLFSQNGIYDFPTNYSDVHIHYNFAGESVIFFFDKEKKRLKVQHKNKVKTLYKQNKVMVKRLNGSLMTTYPKPWISYCINDEDIVKIKITVTNVSTDIVYYDNHMPIAYKEIQTFFKDNKDIMYDYLFYPEDGSKKFFVIKKLFENSGLDTIINSNIEGDSSVNHLVKIWDRHYPLEYSLLKGSYNASQYLILGVKLISLLASTEYAIKNRMWDINGYDLQNYFYGVKLYPREIAFLKKYYDISDGELFWFLKRYLDVLDKQKMNYVEEADFNDYQKLMDDILLENSYYAEHPSAWKNEFMLYRYVKEFVPDTVFQAKPKWLRPQSLDVFIESKSTGIEYQGNQHFQPIDHFGGEKGYLTTVKRDEKKKQKCTEHGVQLLYWNYQDEVTKLSVKEFLQNNGIL